MRAVNLVTMLELFCSTPGGITGEVTHAFILEIDKVCLPQKHLYNLLSNSAQFYFIYFALPWKQNAFILLSIGVTG